MHLDFNFIHNLGQNIPFGKLFQNGSHIRQDVGVIRIPVSILLEINARFRGLIDCEKARQYHSMYAWIMSAEGRVNVCHPHRKDFVRRIRHHPIVS